MRTYNVVENDVDIHDVWRAARESGFRELRVAVFHEPPFHLSLQEFEDFVAGGSTTARWVASTRLFIRNVRTFFLIKQGDAPFDSRWATQLSSTIQTASSSVAIPGRQVLIDARVSNTGSAIWLPADVSPGGVSLGAHLYSEGGKLLQFDMHRVPLTEPPRPVAPGETVRCQMALPPQPTGRYLIELDLVSAGVAWFGPLGSRAVRLQLDVRD